MNEDEKQTEKKPEPSKEQSPLCQLGYEIGRSFAEALQKKVGELVALGQGAEDAYLRAGQPYGDSPEGLRKWFVELALVQTHLKKAQEIMDRHKQLATERAAQEKAETGAYEH